MMKTMVMLGIVISFLVPAENGLGGESGGSASVIISQSSGDRNIAKNESATPFPEKSKPGLFVDSKVGFAILYPVEWASVKPRGREVFRAQPETNYPSLRAWFFPNFTMPLKNLSRVWTTNLKNFSKGEIKTLYDRETKSSSGVVAHEVELEWITNEKTPRPDQKVNSYYFAVKNSKGWVIIGVYSVNGLVQEDIKRKVHAIQIKSQENVSS